MLEVEEALLLLLRRGWRVRLYGSEYAEVEPESPRSGECVLDKEEIEALIVLYNAGFMVIIEHPNDTGCYTMIYPDQSNQYLIVNN